MKTDPQSGVLLLGPSLPYVDGAEDQLLAVMRDVGDCSTGSEELARNISDWPTRYHLSPSRTNLLRPLHLGPNMRVLDAGAGTGALSRYVGELGAEVFALEGSLSRARVAQARCEELPNVTVAAGSLSALDDDSGFDVILLCGMLEYSLSAMGGQDGPDAMLATARRLLRPGGSIVLAIENQLGLKYLLGHPEDHLGRAFVGLEGYPGAPGIRTWSRRVLAERLELAGLSSQAWFYPFPDYKLPKVVLAEGIYGIDDATDIVDQVVRDPAAEEAPLPPVMRADARRVHRTFLDAGLGPDVANSFLVVASPDPVGTRALVDPEPLMWLYGNQRRAVWMRSTVVSPDGDRWVARQHRTFPDSGVAELGFLRQVITAERPYYRGRTLEQELLSAFAGHRYDEAAEILRRWRGQLGGLERDRGDDDPSHPFLPDDATRMLPATYLDVALDNFVESPDGIHYIDDEWELPGGVAVDLAVLRSLWWLARTLVHSGTDHPWSRSATVDDVAVSLAAWLGEVVTTDQMERLRSAEAELQALVGAHPVDVLLNELVRVGSVDRVQLGLRGHQTEGTLARLESELKGTEEQLAAANEAAARAADMEAELAACRELNSEMSAKLAATCADLEETRISYGEALGTLNRIQQRLPMRLYLKAKNLAGRALRA